MHCLTAWGQWAVELLLCTATPPGGSGRCNPCNTLPHYLGAVGSGTPPIYCLTAGGSGQWNSCYALPHCLGAVGSGTPALYCLIAWGQWAVELLQYTASLPGGSGQWNSCNALPHCLGAVGSGTPAMCGPTSWGDGESRPGGGRCRKSGPPARHSHTAWAQWAVELVSRTASLPGGSGQCNSCNTLPYCLGAVGSATPAMHCLTAWGAVGSGTPAIHCLTAWGQWAVGSGAPAIHLTAWGQWAVELLQRTASLPRGGGQWNSCNVRAHQLGGRGVPPRRWSPPKERASCKALPHCLGAVGSGTHVTYCLTAWGQWAVQLLQYTAILPGGSGECNSCNALPHCLGGSGQWNSCNSLPHCLGAVGSGTLARHCNTALAQWAVERMSRTASLSEGSGQWNSCKALPHGTPARHCHTVWGQWALESLQCTVTAWGQWALVLLQRTASLPGGSGQWNSCNTLPHCLGAVGTGKPTMHCHCLGAVGTGTPAAHCFAAWGRWAVELLQGGACGGGAAAPNGPGTPAWGDGESCPGGGWCSRRGLRGAAAPKARARLCCVLCCVMLCCGVLCLSVQCRIALRCVALHVFGCCQH